MDAKLLFIAVEVYFNRVVLEENIKYVVMFVLVGIFYGSNTARVTPSLVSFGGLI